MCTICSHPERQAIERDLLVCPDVAAVAAHYRLPLEEARQHQAHLQARVEHARRQLEQLQLAESLARLTLLLDKTMQVLAAAEDSGDRKLMLQAIKEAGRLTKLLHSLEVEQEPATLLLTAASGDWLQAPSPFSPPPPVREAVRRAIRQSLLAPCAASRLEDELTPPPMSPPEKPVPPVHRSRPSHRPPASAIPWPPALKAAQIPPDSPPAAECNRAGSG